MPTDAPLRVLVVDGDSLLCWALRETLVAAGMVVSHAESFSAAIQAVMSDPGGLDVMLLEYALPDPRGLAHLRTLKRLVPTLPVVVMSAFWTRERADQALEAGADRLVGKPLEMHAAAELVREATGRSRSRPSVMPPVPSQEPVTWPSRR